MKRLFIEPLRGRFAWLIHDDSGTIVRRGLAATLPSLKCVLDGQPGADSPVDSEPVDDSFVAAEGLTPEQANLCASYGWLVVAAEDRPGTPELWQAIIPEIARR